jgi:hypothetical protein
MANNPTEKTLADYVAIAIGPVLIMALVGSLVFFLLEVLYVGQYTGRLQWILFFFVFGAVLIARISMTSEIAGRAGLYGLVLGGLVWVALLLYVEYPPESRFAQVGWLINLFLIAVIWWSAHRLTWDCTLIDDSVDASGAGLLQMAGLDQGQDAQEPTPDRKEGAKKKKKEPTGLSGWWQRYRKYRAEQGRRPHAPGVWVVYFSLAALPLFGLGQLLMSADRARDEAQRAASQRYAFFLMTVYVGSGLGLLLTTSFLGLRRYLRQRGVKMPAAVTSVWLVLGGLLAAGLLLLGGFLPRPSAGSSSFLEWAGLTSPERDASEWSDDSGDGTGKDKGTGAKGTKSGKGNEKGSGRDGRGREKADDARGSGRDKSGSSDGKGGEGKGGKDGRGKGNAKSGKKEGRGASDKKGDKGDSRGERSDSGARSPLPKMSPEFVTALKWIVGIVVALVVLFMVLRSGLGWLANFTTWARRLLDALRAFWQGLWGRGGSAGKQVAETEAERPAPPRPFASFHDPFATGEAEGMSPEALVRYSFEALEAWATERKVARQAGETPLEFAERLGGEYPAVEADVRRLTNLVAGLAYAREGIDPECRDDLRQFWQTIVDAVERPMSAGVGSR